jgi:hypothetical protein
MGCFSTILFLAGFVLVMVSFIRWFEQTTEAVDNGWWNKVFILVICPFTVWFFPSRVNAGRTSPFPRHEPVRGFGSLPKTRPTTTTEKPLAEASDPVAPSAPVSDQPPPGTPKEFLTLPKVPPPKQRGKSSVDPEKIAKLKQKMREQGMLPPDEQ